MTGNPLSMAIIGVSSLDLAKNFYQNVIGLDSSEVFILGGREFERHWNLPQSSMAEALMFSMGNLSIGRILAIKFDTNNSKRIINENDRTYQGLWNLNFYVDDIVSVADSLRQQGFRFWSEPVGYEVSARAGNPIEVLFDGPDGLAINLVQLTGDAQTEVGKLRKEVNSVGKTAKGFSPVATTSHSVVDHQGAYAFYKEVLGLEVLIDDILDKPETNFFLGRPKNAKTRATFFSGNHPFGKIALSYPMNYKVRNKLAIQRPPNIGYLAQSFMVEDLDKSFRNAVEIGSEIFSAISEIEIPSHGRRKAAVVRNPGSGALMQLIEEKKIE